MLLILPNLTKNIIKINICEYLENRSKVNMWDRQWRSQLNFILEQFQQNSKIIITLFQMEITHLLGKLKANFIARDRCPRQLMIAMIVFEFLSITNIINPSLTFGLLEGFYQQHESREDVSTILPLIILLTGSFITKLWLKFSVFRVIYIFIIYQIQKQPDYISIPIYFILAVYCTADILSTTQYSFYSGQILSERHNQIKILHYVLNITTFVCFRYTSYAKLLSCCVYLSMFLLRSLLPMTSKKIQRMQEFLYLALGLLSLISLTQYFGQGVGSVVIVLTVIGMVMKHKIQKKLKLFPKKIQSGNISRQFLEVFYYVFNGNYEQQSSKSVLTYLRMNQLILEIPAQNLEINIENRSQLVRILTQFIKSSSEVDWKNRLIQAQIKLSINHNIFEAKSAIQSLKYSQFNIFRAVLVSRLEQDFLNYFQYRYSVTVTSHFIDFMNNQKFIDMLLDSSRQFENLWRPIHNSEMILQQVQDLANRVRKSICKVQNFYDNLTIKTKSLGIQYFFYLHYVQRNIKKSRQILSNCYRLSDPPTEYPKQNIVTFSVSFQQDSFGQITNISENVFGVLGYTQESMMGVYIDELVPQFFRQSHRMKMKELYESLSEDNPMDMLRKTAICENSHGLMYEVSVNMKLALVMEQLVMIGYLELLNKDSPKNILVVDAQCQEIIARSIYSNNDILQKLECVPEDFDKKLIINQEKYIKLTTINLISGDKVYIYKSTSGSVMRLSCLKQLIPKDTKPISLVKFCLPSNSTLTAFFSLKKKTIQVDLSQRKICIIVAFGIFLIVAAGIASGLNFMVNNMRTDEKIANLQNSQFLSSRQSKFVLFLCKLHFLVAQQQMGVNFNLKNLSAAQVMQGSVLSNPIIKVYGSQIKATQTFSQNRSLQITSFELLQSVRAYTAFAIQNVKTQRLDSYTWVLNYLKLNEFEVMQHVFVNIRLFHLSYVNNRILLYQVIWYALQTLYQILVFSVIVLLIFYEKKINLMERDVAIGIFSIGQKDRKQFSKTICFFIDMIVNASKDFQIPGQTNNNIGVTPRVDNRSFASSFTNIMSLNSQNSPSLLMSPKSSRRFLNYYAQSKHSRRQSDQPMHHQIKQRRLNLFRLFVYILAMFCAITLTVFVIVNSQNVNFSTKIFVKNIYNQQNITLSYFQKIQFFFHTLNNPADYWMIAAIKPQKLAFFDESILQYNTFKKFNELYNNMSKGRLCDFVNCTDNSICGQTASNTSVQGLMIYYTSQIDKMARQIVNGQRTGSQIMRDPFVAKIACTTSFLLSRFIELQDIFFQATYNLMAETHQQTQNLFIMQILLIACILFGTVLPFIIIRSGMIESVKQTLNLINEDIYFERDQAH